MKNFRSCLHRYLFFNFSKNLNSKLRRTIKDKDCLLAHLQVEDVLAVFFELPISSLFPRIDHLLVLLFGLLLFLDDPLDPGFFKLGDKPVDASVRSDGEAVPHFQKLVGGV